MAVCKNKKYGFFLDICLQRSIHYLHMLGKFEWYYVLNGLHGHSLGTVTSTVMMQLLFFNTNFLITQNLFFRTAVLCM